MPLLRSTLMGFCLLACACNMRNSDEPPPTAAANNIIYVTATPLPVAQAAATATSTPLPTPIPPTATREPTSLLQSGERYVRNGYFEEAAGIYRSLLNYGVAIAPEYRAYSAFRLGQVALRAGYFQQALDAFSLLITEFPADLQIAQAYFLRGDARLGLAQWAAAIDDFQQYLALRQGLIDSYVYERIADAQVALGQHEAALEHYQAAINAQRSKVPLLVLREKLAQIYINLGRPSQAVSEYDAILAVARNAPYRASMAFLAAQTLLEGGDRQAGLERMAAVVTSYRATAAAWDALQLLSQFGIEYDGLQRGNAAFIAGDYQAAINAFNQFTASHQLAAIPAQLFLTLGRAYRQIGNADAAAIAFQTLIDQYPADPLLGDALLERGRTRFLAGDSPAAIRLYLAIADNYPSLADAAGVALWRAGYLYGTNGETALSRQVFTRLAEAYPDHELTSNGLFIAASAAVREQAWSQADYLYAKLATLSSGSEQAAAYLWVGRIALLQNDAALASEAFDSAIRAAPDSYFAARAGDFRIGRQPFQAPSAYRFDFDEDADMAAAEAWLRRTFALEAAGELWRLSPELNSDPRMIRGRELYAVGAVDDAFIEFEELVDDARESGNALDSYRLAIYLRGLGAYRESIIAAADLIIASNQGTLQAPPFVARLRFPAYYSDVIRPATEARGIDPLLLLSLIRQESLFNTFATAGAGEKGLTQVIPATGQYIADRLDWADYQHSDLFRPYAGVAFGAYYLDEQLELFDQNAIVALAAYNAGPGRALDWQALSGGEPDLFMTTITIDSTRHYVQFIYRNYNIYRELYGGAGS